MKMYAHGDFFIFVCFLLLFFFFLLFDPAFFPPLSLSLSPSLSLHSLLLYVTHFVCWAILARLIGVAGAALRRNNCKTVKVMTQGSRCENVCAWRCFSCFFFFFFFFFFLFFFVI